jgi:hypothetical protein
MSDQDKIISFLRMTGPTLPAKVAKCIDSNILIASAYLSELSSQGKIKISHLKVGGSPLYYLPEHKDKLQNFLHNFNPKDQQTLNLLKENKILKEKNLDLLARVSLRKIKDFAVPLNISLNNQKELFWKWYLITDSQAVEIIKSQLSPRPESKPESHPPVKQNLLQEKTAPPTAVPPSEIKEKPVSTEKPKKHLLQKLKEKLKPRRKSVPDSFFPKIEAFFTKKEIKIEVKETLRKNAEMNFIINVPSVIGRTTYFCKTKNKKRCDERDLSAAYMEAQSKKLPLLFIYTNELTKRAQEMLDSGTFKNLVIKKLD